MEVVYTLHPTSRMTIRMKRVTICCLCVCVMEHIHNLSYSICFLRSIVLVEIGRSFRFCSFHNNHFNDHNNAHVIQIENPHNPSFDTHLMYSVLNPILLSRNTKYITSFAYRGTTIMSVSSSLFHSR